MRSSDAYKNKAARSQPSQDRGKERVRLILASALTLFKEQGPERVTTNDIAAQAGIPIGSLYRYYPNKNSILVALTELYVEDIIRIFEQVAKHPRLQYLSWDEVLLLLIDGWVSYSRLNGPFEFLYIERVNPAVRLQTKTTWGTFVLAFNAVLTRHCARLTPRELAICFHFCVAAVELGVNHERRATIGQRAHHDAIRVVASYLATVCAPHRHLRREP